MNTRQELERHETILQTLLKGFRELQRLQDQHSQAILDLDAALREAQARQELALPSPPAPASQNATTNACPVRRRWLLGFDR